MAFDLPSRRPSENPLNPSIRNSKEDRNHGSNKNNSTDNIFTMEQEFRNFADQFVSHVRAKNNEGDGDAQSNGNQEFSLNRIFAMVRKTCIAPRNGEIEAIFIVLEFLHLDVLTRLEAATANIEASVMPAGLQLNF
ncbi:MAG: hypothetical protein NZX77_17635 [Polyangiaceae bacterium]|nr:hypothetical protein [Polyangiaceae bacterium]